MSRANDHAFPIPCVAGLPNGNVDYGAPGMTIREHFASLAMQGYLSSLVHCDQSTPWTAVATWSVEMADCLIAELAKVQP